MCSSSPITFTVLPIFFFVANFSGGLSPFLLHIWIQKWSRSIQFLYTLWKEANGWRNCDTFNKLPIYGRLNTYILKQMSYLWAVREENLINIWRPGDILNVKERVKVTRNNRWHRGNIICSQQSSLCLIRNKTGSYFGVTEYWYVGPKNILRWKRELKYTSIQGKLKYIKK